MALGDKRSGGFVVRLSLYHSFPSPQLFSTAKRVPLIARPIFFPLFSTQTHADLRWTLQREKKGCTQLYRGAGHSIVLYLLIKTSASGVFLRASLAPFRLFFLSALAAYYCAVYQTKQRLSETKINSFTHPVDAVQKHAAGSLLVT